MDKEIRTQILNEAIKIGDELLLSAKENIYGEIYWETWTTDSDKELDDPQYFKFEINESIYNGISGITIFLIELYRQTKIERYLCAAQDAANWLSRHCKDNATNFYSFYSGRMGVVYVFTRLFEVTQRQRYLDLALSIAKKSAVFIQQPFVINDLLNGAAGTLLGLIHLHKISQEIWVLDEIRLFIEHLIKNALYSHAGVYWDYSEQNIRGLCGFSHGASGIGFVLGEAGRYLNNPGLFILLKQATLYETNFYNSKVGNWPDFRCGIWDKKSLEEHKYAISENDISFFTSERYMTAWCHGAPGIGLSRLRAYELLHEKKFLNDAQNAITTVIKSLPDDSKTLHNKRLPSYTLCHGLGGNSELLLEGYRILNDKNLLDLAFSVAQKSIYSKKEYGYYLSGFHTNAGSKESHSLFMGNAGIGYFYLRCLDPLSTPSILMPYIKSLDLKLTKQFSGFSQENLSRTLVKTVFPITMTLMDNLIGRCVSNFFSISKNLNQFIQFTENIICDSDIFSSESLRNENESIMKGDIIDALPALTDVFQFELNKWETVLAIESNALLRIQEILLSEKSPQLKPLSEHALLKKYLVLNHQRVSFRIQGWNWLTNSTEDWFANLKTDKGEFHIALVKSARRGVLEYQLSEMAFQLLLKFDQPYSLGLAIEELTDATLDLNPDIKKEHVTKFAIDQIKGAFEAHIVASV